MTMTTSVYFNWNDMLGDTFYKLMVALPEVDYSDFQ
jgi:hypothetical protein